MFPLRLDLTLLLSLCLLVFTASSQADDERFPFESVEMEERFDDLTEELRCLVCQNQSLADSDAPLANDLRDQVYDMVSEGQSNEQIVDYLVTRYGEFVLYRPPMNTKTLFLWGAPVFFLLIGAIIVIILIRRKPAKQETDEAKLARLREMLADQETSQSDQSTQGGK